MKREDAFAVNPEFMDLSQGEVVVRAVRNLLFKGSKVGRISFSVSGSACDLVVVHTEDEPGVLFPAQDRFVTQGGEVLPEVLETEVVFRFLELDNLALIGLLDTGDEFKDVVIAVVQDRS